MSKKKVTVIIPARMGSTRFPGKPLAKILGLPMIEHVRRRVSLCDSIDDIYVATCDNEIREVVESYGGKVVMTSPKHERCTERIEEAASVLDSDIIVNVQGDEPVISPAGIEEVIIPLKKNKNVPCSCLIYPITDVRELKDVNIVKAVLDQKNYLMYLSRSPIPYFKVNNDYDLYKQSGIMAFRKQFLHKYSKLAPTPLERAESVDVLRILEHGYKMMGVITPHVTIGVDIPEHIKQVEKFIMEDKEQRAVYERIYRF